MVAASSMSEPQEKSLIGFRARATTPPNLPVWLDFARVVAAIEVVAFHSYQLMFLERSPPNDGSLLNDLYAVLQSLSAHGTAAVIVFFVLSGYLVGGPAIIRARTGELSAIEYVSARAARLYVVLIPALVVSLCAYGLARHLPTWNLFAGSRHDLYDASRLLAASGGVATAVCNALYLQTIACPEFAGNLALWSLSNEFWYYVLIFLLVSVRGRPGLAILIIGVFALFVYAERHDPTGTHIGAKFVFYFAIWCLGVAVYAVQARPIHWLGAFVLCLGAVWLLCIEGVVPNWAASEMTTGLVAAAAIVSLELSETAMSRVFRPVAGCAKYSFSLYATHYPVLVLMNVMFSSGGVEFTLPALLRFLSFALCCMALSVGFFLLFEVHTKAVRKFVERCLDRLTTSRMFPAGRAPGEGESQVAKATAMSGAPLPECSTLAAPEGQHLRQA
jgi:peptidoglycan/LPS O-acetylase OafA/YrhL